MAKKQPAAWVVFAEGTAMSFAVYLLIQLLLALLMVKAVLPERYAFGAVAAACGLSALLGGCFCARRSSLGKLAGSLISAAGFAALLIAGGFLFWEGISWTGKGGVLLLTVLIGGVLAGLLSSKRGRRVKRKGKRR